MKLNQMGKNKMASIDYYRYGASRRKKKCQKFHWFVVFSIRLILNDAKILFSPNELIFSFHCSLVNRTANEVLHLFQMIETSLHPYEHNYDLF